MGCPPPPPPPPPRPILKVGFCWCLNHFPPANYQGWIIFRTKKRSLSLNLCELHSLHFRSFVNLELVLYLNLARSHSLLGEPKLLCLHCWNRIRKRVLFHALKLMSFSISVCMTDLVKLTLLSFVTTNTFHLNHNDDYNIYWREFHETVDVQRDTIIMWSMLHMYIVFYGKKKRGRGDRANSLVVQDVPNLNV